jgi:hypothetical protein
MISQEFAKAQLSNRPYFEVRQGKVIVRDEELIQACQLRQGLQHLLAQAHSAFQGGLPDQGVHGLYKSE